MRLSTWVIGVPAGLATIYLAVANRHLVLFSFDPFNAQDPAIGLSIPLYLLLFLAFIIGVVVGGSASWVGQGRWRQAARRNKKRASHLEKDLERIEGPTS